MHFLMAVLTVTLFDMDKGLVDQWTAACERLLSAGLRERVLVVHESLRTLIAGPDRIPFDCVVSPANSFGLMDGGIDLALSRAFGGVDVTIAHVQKALWTECLGQQNTGTCLIIDMAPLAGPCKFLAHCPTMRVPCTIDPGSDIVYRCMWSILLAVHKHNLQHADAPDSSISRLLCSGLGTGVGRVPAAVCAEQMVLAIKHYLELAVLPQGVPKVWDWNAAEVCDDEVQAAAAGSTHVSRRP